jgi:cellulose synthase/poly-beta-1,6-N-acetylglucosamine synthase-like glycosyltransferase
MLELIITMYGFFTLTHLFIQINLAHMEYIRHNKDKPDYGFNPKVGIIVPMYNEDYSHIRRTVLSCMSQSYENCWVVLVDDGSNNPHVYHMLEREFSESSRVMCVRTEENKGKRHAQKLGFDLVDDYVDIIVTVDSDTVLSSNGIRMIVQKFRDEKVGAVTGNVRAVKEKAFLTKLIDGRYFSAFNQERSAQSLFGTVLCCSGPFSAYRARIIKKVKDRFASQTFLGAPCTYGDDRHLTNLVLEEGYIVKYDSKAHAVTRVPTKIVTFLKQQVRWNKSYYRELLWTMRIFFRNPRRFHPYILYDLTIQTILPLMLVGTLGYAVFRALTESPVILLYYLIMVFGVALLRTAYIFTRSKDITMLYFPVYSLLHIFLLIPARIYALLSMQKTHWGTR